MAFTTHGHHIPGTSYYEVEEPKNIHRCGGVRVCEKCKREAKAVFGVELCTSHGVLKSDCIACDPNAAFKSKFNKLEVELKDEEGTIHLGPGVVRNGTVTFNIYELSERYNVTFRTIEKDK